MNHLDVVTVVDYWARELGKDREAAVEDHAFECDDCGRRFAAFGELGDGIRRVVGRRGGIGLFLTQSLVDDLERAGVVMRHYRARLGDIIPCGIGVADDLLVSHLATDTLAIAQPSVTLSVGDQVMSRLQDVPIDHATNQIIWAISGDVARTFPTMKIVARLFDGERLLGETIFDHTAFSV